MEKNLGILGVGECGTKISAELALEFDLGLLSFLPLAPKLSFRLLWERVFSNTRAEKRNTDMVPEFYVGDFNRKNDTYLLIWKMTYISNLVRNEGITDPAKIQERLVSDKNYQRFAHEGDKELIKSYLASKSTAIFNLLEFYSGDSLVMSPHGSGGLQYISESLIKESNSELITKISESKVDTMIGVFGSGGGSGSGSILALLSNDKNKDKRFSLGMAIFPEKSDLSEYSNTGRFLINFFSRDQKKRFDKILVTSNRAAACLLSGDKKEKEEQVVIRQKLNSYVGKIIFVLSVLNRSNIKTMAGKGFDTLDCKRYIPELGFVGYSEDNGNIDNLIVEAISPIGFKSGSLIGLSGLVTDDSEVNDRIRVSLGSIFNSIEIEKSKKVLISSSGLYSNFRKVIIFAVCEKESHCIGLQNQKQRLERFFKELTGTNVEIKLNIYQSKESPGSKVAVFIDTGLNIEIVDSLKHYLKRYFFGNEDENTKKFTDSFLQAARLIKSETSSIKIDQIVSGFKDSVFHLFLSDFEILTEQERNYISDSDFLPEEIKKPDSDYFITREKCLSAFTNLLFQMRKSSDIEVRNNPYDDEEAVL